MCSKWLQYDKESVKTNIHKRQNQTPPLNRKDKRHNEKDDEKLIQFDTITVFGKVIHK